MSGGNIKIAIENLNVFYPKKQVLRDVNVLFPEKSITAIVGPSGCGKSTLLMIINRLLDSVPHARVEGKVRIRLNRGRWLDVRKLKEAELPALRRRVCLVFQHPNVLPMSIFKNLAFPLRLLGLRESKIKERVRKALHDVSLWDEVKDRLNSPASELSGGQQQRLCLARALVLEPEVLLLDEPTSFLDEAAAQKIESLLISLKNECTVVVVSHYLDQVKRLADHVFSLDGGHVKELE